MKAKDDKVRLIQCFPESNKGFNKDVLIVSGGGGGATTVFIVRQMKGHQVGYSE